MTTDDTGTKTADTVAAAVVLFPSLVAVITTLPAETPVTSPLGDTIATSGLELVHSTTRSVKTVPLESRTVATSCVVAPTSMLNASGETEMLATGSGSTVTVA